jgi:hypothetical protein
VELFFKIATGRHEKFINTCRKSYHAAKGEQNKSSLNISSRPTPARYV